MEEFLNSDFTDYVQTFRNEHLTVSVAKAAAPAPAAGPRGFLESFTTVEWAPESEPDPLRDLRQLAAGLEQNLQRQAEEIQARREEEQRQQELRAKYAAELEFNRQLQRQADIVHASIIEDMRRRSEEQQRQLVAKERQRHEARQRREQRLRRQEEERYEREEERVLNIKSHIQVGRS